MNRRMRQRVTGLLLVFFALSALIPPGFMPSADNPFVLQICPDGFPDHLLRSSGVDHHATHHGHMAHAAHEHGAADHAGQDSEAPAQPHELSSSQHCLFGSAPGIGPLSQVPATAHAAPADASLLPAFATPVPTSQRYRIQQPRGPPQLS